MTPSAWNAGVPAGRSAGVSPAVPIRRLVSRSDARNRHHMMCDKATMRTTINLDENLIEEARRITGTRERTALIHGGLRALIARESARRLDRLGGSDPRATAPRRRRAS